MQEQINSAVALYSSGQIQKALNLVKSLIKDNSKEAILHNIAGACYSSLGQLTDAIDSFNEAIKIKPDYAEAHNSLGASLQAIGKLNEAVESYKNAIVAFPNYVQARTNLWNKMASQSICACRNSSATCHNVRQLIITFYSLS